MKSSTVLVLSSRNCKRLLPCPQAGCAGGPGMKGLLCSLSSPAEPGLNKNMGCSPQTQTIMSWAPCTGPKVGTVSRL